jgi:hypothetical protein
MGTRAKRQSVMDYERREMVVRLGHPDFRQDVPCPWY